MNDAAAKQKTGLEPGALGAPRLALATAVLAAAAAPVGLAAAAAASPPAAACAAPPAAPARGVALETGRVASVDERLDLALEDGRAVKIAGLDPPRPTPDAPEGDLAAAQKLGAWLAGQEIIFVPVFTAPDRWGRFVAEVYAPATRAPGAPAISVAAAALDAGLARFQSSAASRRCRAFLLAAEAPARRARLGLWADPYYGVLAADDRAAFAERAGTVVLVEGDVRSVDEGPFRTLLLFGERRGWNFSVAIERRRLKAFAAAGFDVSTLKGKTVRVRGLLDLRFGPQIEIEGPDEIETASPAQDAALERPATGQPHPADKKMPNIP